jgi:hypothetical protein
MESVMNCCDGDCNQGRDCPIRVARVRSRDYAKEAYPPSKTPRHIRALAKWMLIAIVTSTVATAFLFIV